MHGTASACRLPHTVHSIHHVKCNAATKTENDNNHMYIYLEPNNAQVRQHRIDARCKTPLPIEPHGHTL